jgi:hypothetical protein
MINKSKKCYKEDKKANKMGGILQETVAQKIKIIIIQLKLRLISKYSKN